MGVLSATAAIRVVPLGAGQDVGRSCVLVTIGGKNIMFDCGMHMGYNDHRRYPDFSYLSNTGSFDDILDCIIVSHFHLDHCGALPHFTEQLGYSGPIYMTYPTKAICPILLDDMRRVAVDRKGEQNFFTEQDVRNCMKKVTPVDLHQVVHVDDELEIKAYYAGHVLGAAMFHIRVGDQSVVYTGDYNMTPDRHLGPAWIDRCRPDLLITESTYASFTRESKRTREHDFLKKVHATVRRGGKVLVPVFALGRAQELCILLEAYWDRMDDLRDGKVPVYFSAGMTERANEYYKLFINWTNEKIKEGFVERNLFDFRHITAWQHEFADRAGPMVLFASPGMLHAGTSLMVFKKWCHDPRNTVILPGYCVAGTVGAKVLAGETRIAIDPHTTVDVNLAVENLSFSAHADAKGILQLIKMCAPRNVMLVHGEKAKMTHLKKRIRDELGIPGFDPANGEAVLIGGPDDKEREVRVLVDGRVARRAWNNAEERQNKDADAQGVEFAGTLVIAPNGKPTHILPAPKTHRFPAPPPHCAVTKLIDPRPYITPPPDSNLVHATNPRGLLFTAVETALRRFVIGCEISAGSAKEEVVRLKKSATDEIVTVALLADPACGVKIDWDGEGQLAEKVVAILNAVF
ncbi:Integrator complex subunit 11 [Geranomyces variabilis]|nr:Integrator complex subunit 11 [Geranomyces variabilis]